MVEKIKAFYKSSGNKINGMKFKKWLAANPDLNEYLNSLLNKHPNLVTLSNISFCLANDIDINGFKCKTCGKLLKIRAITQPVEFCSVKCAMSNSELQQRKAETIKSDSDYWKKRQEKIIKTNLERYGTKAPSQNKDIAQKMKDTCAKDPDHWKKRQEKSEKTCMERYGVKNASSTIEVREKVIQTNMKKYGVANPNKLPEIQEKIKQTCLEKYGVDCQFKRPEVIGRRKKKYKPLKNENLK